MLRGIATAIIACVVLGAIAWLSTHAMAGSVQNISLFCAGLSGARRWFKL
jgi:hypothetical protein